MIPPMRGMRPEDVYALAGRLRPAPRSRRDDRRVRRSGRSTATRTSTARTSGSRPVDGSEPPRRFTTGERRDGEPRWSPDGTRLAFVSSRAEKEPGQLYVIPLRGGEAQRLTKLKEDVSDVAWSPDGSHDRVHVARPRRGVRGGGRAQARRRRGSRGSSTSSTATAGRPIVATQLFVVPADGTAEPRQLTDGEYEHARRRGRPTARQIAFASARGEDWDMELVSDIYLVPADGGEPQPADARATAATALRSGRRTGSRSSRSSRRTRGSGARHTQIAVIDAETGEHRLLTESLDRQCGPYPELREPIWDGDRSSSESRTAATSTSTAVPADGSGEPELLVGGERARQGLRRQGRHARARHRHADDVRRALRRRHARDRRRRRTSRRASVEPERFTAISKDGTEVEAWLVRPAGFEEGKRYPVLLNIHGGPSRSTDELLRRVPGLRRRAATPSCTRTRAARRATARTGGRRSAGPLTAAAPAGAPSTTRT